MRQKDILDPPTVTTTSHPCGQLIGMATSQLPPGTNLQLMLKSRYECNFALIKSIHNIVLENFRLVSEKPPEHLNSLRFPSSPRIYQISIGNKTSAKKIIRRNKPNETFFLISSSFRPANFSSNIDKLLIKLSNATSKAKSLAKCFF